MSDSQHEILDDAVFAALAELAWNVRANALVIGPTRVGCAVLSANRRMYVGCNVEHRFRSHDVHAEVNAMTTMVAAGDRDVRCIVIAAERDQFTPCGACMDWIFQVGSEETIVAFQAVPKGPLVKHRARELMPYYPR